MEIKPPNYRFCPMCSESLMIRIEEGRERKYCPNCGWRYFPVPGIAVAAVITKKDKVLMVKRNRMPFKETYMFLGGFVEFGESLHDAVCREVNEESGLLVVKIELFRIEQSFDDPRAPGHFVLFHKVEAEGRISNRDKEENQSVGWFPIVEPPEIGFPTHKIVMNILQDERRK